MYKIIAATAGLDYLKVELNDDFSLNEEAMLTAMAEHQPELVFIANPNNPSGNLFDRATLETIIDKAPGLVVIDEAYSSFASESLMSNLPKFSHKMLVMRTLSKSGLAGLRLGMLTGSTAWINEFNKIRLPYNINTLTQKSVEFMLNNYYVLQRQADKIKQERARLYAALTDIEDITAYPSEANFILFRTAVGTADAIHQKLKKSGILIKNLNGSHPLLNDCLRVSIGTTKENDIFMRQLTTL